MFQGECGESCLGRVEFEKPTGHPVGTGLSPQGRTDVCTGGANSERSEEERGPGLSPEAKGGKWGRSKGWRAGGTEPGSAVTR